MTTSFESPAMYERDMRSANKEWRRGKDHATKWAFGARPLYGRRTDLVTIDTVDDGECQRTKVRPRRRGNGVLKMDHNLTEYNDVNVPAPARRSQPRVFTREDIDDASRSIGDLVSSPVVTRSMSASDNFLYSFDRTESPGRPLALDLFVKPASPRDTERLVRKEYEVLDTNGQPLKGRKAKRDLRRSPFDHTPDVDEDEGFELV